MRNLAQYPITPDEVIEVLVRAHHELYNPEQMGDLTGYILSKLTMLVRDNPELIDQMFDITNERTTSTVSRISNEV